VDHTIIEEPASENYPTKLVSRKRQTSDIDLAPEELDAIEEDNTEVQNSEQNIGLDLLEFADPTKTVPAKRLSAIRTIRGSRVGVVPVSN
jgi:hypothetical protein